MEFIAYYYEGSYHCPGCAEKRFCGWQNVAGERDKDGNYIVPISVEPMPEGYKVAGYEEGMTCNECGTVIIPEA